MPAKFDSCVRKVRAKSKGRGPVNAYAVCTAAGTRDSNPGFMNATVDEAVAKLTPFYHDWLKDPEKFKRAYGDNFPWGQLLFRLGTRMEDHDKIVDAVMKAARSSNPGYGRHLDDDYAPVKLYKYFTTESAAKSYAQVQGWGGPIEHKRGGWPGARSWVAGEEYRVMVPGGGTAEIGRRNPETSKYLIVGVHPAGGAGKLKESPGRSEDLWATRQEAINRAKELSDIWGSKVRLYKTDDYGGQRVLVKSNPDSSAADMYESFHGSPSEEVLEFREDEHYHGNLAGLGVLVELKLVTITGYDVTLSFSDPETLIAANKRNPGIWDRLKRVGSKSTVYHFPRHIPEKMTKATSFKGHEIFKTMDGDYRVPSLERESSFDSLADAKKFVGAWKGNPGNNPGQWARPNHRYRLYRAFGSGLGSAYKSSDSLSDLKEEAKYQQGIVDEAYYIVDLSKGSPSVENVVWVLGSARGKSRVKNPGPFQSASKLIGSTGKYLDDQLGRVLNPRGVHGRWHQDSLYNYGYRYIVLSEEHLPTSRGGLPPAFRTLKDAQEELTRMGKHGQGLHIAKLVPGDQELNYRAKNPSLDPALLCSNESGTQLYIVGGDQSVDLKSIHMADVPTKDSMVLGEAYFVSYFTQKDFDGHKNIIYEHQLGELADKKMKLVGQGSGIYPTVRYDTINERIYLDGGEYKIEKPLVGTSPGIEG